MSDTARILEELLSPNVEVKYEMRRYYPLPDETKWIVILKSEPNKGEPNYHSMFSYSGREEAEKMVANLNAGVDVERRINREFPPAHTGRVGGEVDGT